MTKTMNVTRVRRMLSNAWRMTDYYPQTNQTHYPARWTYDNGYAGNAQTAVYGDQQGQLAVDRVAQRLGVRSIDVYAGGQRLALRDVAPMLLAAYNAKTTA